MSTAVSSLRDGAGRVLRAPVILAGATLLTLSLAWPLHELMPHTGEVDLPGRWWRQCAAPAIWVHRSLESSVLGCTAQLAGLTASSPGASRVGGRVVGYLGGCFLLLWTFLSGGMIDRYARGRPTRSAGFFAACGLYGTRLVRLGLIAALTYGALFGLLQSLLFGPLLEPLIGPAPSTARVAIQATLYALVAVLAGVAGLVFDYARVRAVVEDRRSMIGAVLAGWRFVRHRPVACAGLYGANGLLLVAVIAATPLVTPGSGRLSWMPLLAAVACLLARAGGRLLFYSVETAYFQSQLAHAGYVAAPTPVWPESSSAEALGRLG